MVGTRRLELLTSTVSIPGTQLEGVGGIRREKAGKTHRIRRKRGSKRIGLD
jgi:hypothetical protein